MLLDRTAQKTILVELSRHYPGQLDVQNPMPVIGLAQDTAYFQLAYLEEHGLVNCHWSSKIGSTKRCILAKITAKGLDFLEEDGGLTSILGVVTVKLHDETIRKLLEAKLQSSGIPNEQKARLIDRIRRLPGAAVKLLAEKLMEKGAEQLAEEAFDAVDAFLNIVG